MKSPVSVQMTEECIALIHRSSSKAIELQVRQTSADFARQWEKDSHNREDVQGPGAGLKEAGTE